MSIRDGIAMLLKTKFKQRVLDARRSASDAFKLLKSDVDMTDLAVAADLAAECLRQIGEARSYLEASARVVLREDKE